MGNRCARLAILALILTVAASTAPMAAGGKGKSEKPSSKPAGKAAAKSGSAEQGTWKVRLLPDAEAAAKGEKQSDDVLHLQNGKFHSTGCDLYGFGPADYTVDGNRWKAETRSEKEGAIHWHGEVAGDSIAGKMQWTRKDGTVRNYSFTGARAGSQHAPATQPAGKSAGAH
jgi:hypothetical protein